VSKAQPFGLYIHWPFCRSKCPYCDFNSHVADAIDHGRWREAYLHEIATLAPRLAGRDLASIFFGGGTPSLMHPETTAAIIEAARALWPGTEPEITLEANPTSIEAEKFAGFRAAGVNRVSVGVQALDDDALRFLGREHSAKEALAALDVARHTFARVNADIIYARPGQDAAAWQRELSRLLELGLGHLSLYQLTIERGTPFFGLHNKGAFELPDEDMAAELYETTGEMLARAGLFAYEVSNYARPGEECRHNLIYWRGQDYLGIGPGAHGRLPGKDGGRSATANLRRPDDWLAQVEKTGHGIGEDNALSRAEIIEERVMMGLRLAEGIAADIIPDKARLPRLIAGGFLEQADGRIRSTAEGRLRLNAVIADLLG
jgi:putative oxygen-independent coproporphyrinogen III oxidase